MKNKGQMFLIAAAIIIVILVLLKTSINLPDILQREKELKSRFEKEFFSNIVDELVKVVDISYHQSSNITNNVFDFGNFTRKKMTERSQDFNFFYIGAITPASQGSDTMNVTVINLLNKDVDLILNLNGTVKNFTGSSVTTTAVETEGVLGQQSSIALDSNGKVHISHRNSSTTAYDLRYCNNTAGTWNCMNIETSSGSSQFGAYSSIAIDSNDKVHIAHINFTTPEYSLRYCNNTNGWTCTNVDSPPAAILDADYSHIALDSNDKVHIIYLMYQDILFLYSLRYCNNTLGSWSCTSIESQAGSFGPLSIAIDSQDHVHIPFQDTDGDLRYCNNTAGTWNCADIDTGGSVGNYLSIAIDSNDKVHISHQNVTAFDLRYCNNTNGWTCTDVEMGGQVGYYSSIAIDSNDKPHISHLNYTDNTLRYCYTKDFSTWNCQKIDDTDGTIDTNGRAIAIKKGRLCDSTSFSPDVHMSYYKTTGGDLMYAKVFNHIKDLSSWDTNFTITQGNDYILTVDYGNNQENITINTKDSKSVYAGFFDITLTGSETTYKDKFQKSYTLP